MNDVIRAIAFYLPQFHPVPENDEWWGKGFTEWANVSKARPLFPGHYQPHQPADLGFYDLRLPETREAQATLAREYGIHGFCYYHYWFNGRRILERPFNDVLSSGKPDFPFCLCWANENWTKVWDGGGQNILLGQNYSHEDDLAHIQSLMPAFRDERYIRIDGRPLFLVYRTELLPNPKRTAEIWRQAARAAGIGEIYLAQVESFVDSDASNSDPAIIGFDASVEFAPDWRTLQTFEFRNAWFRRAVKWGMLPDSYLAQYFTQYDDLVGRMLEKPDPDYLRFRCVTPGFDNSARRSEKGAAVYIGNTPDKYAKWLAKAVRDTLAARGGDERIVFVNAWNEWAEGNHLEPDQKFGRGFLESTRRALVDTQAVLDSAVGVGPVHGSTTIGTWYTRLIAQMAELREVIWHIQFHRRRK